MLVWCICSKETTVYLRKNTLRHNENDFRVFQPSNIGVSSFSLDRSQWREPRPKPAQGPALAPPQKETKQRPRTAGALGSSKRQHRRQAPAVSDPILASLAISIVYCHCIHMFRHLLLDECTQFATQAPYPELKLLALRPKLDFKK